MSACRPIQEPSVLPTVGIYGTPFNRIISAGVSKGPLVRSFLSRVSWMDEKEEDDDDDGGVRSGDGAGAEIGWVNLSCRPDDPWIVSCFVKV